MMKFSIKRDGFSMVEGLLSDQEVESLLDFVEKNIPTEDSRGGVRNLLDFQRMRDLAESTTILKEVQAVLGDGARVVRGILFDKTEGANWKVPWHQDVTIAVKRRIEAEGFGLWSSKAGVLHVQPPTHILERMVSIRLHLDNCPQENGALRVIAGSHVNGKLDERLVPELAERCTVVTCTMRRGGALVMRPLLLHASSSSIVPSHRRVIHFDYAAVDLPVGMGWAVN